MAVNDFSNQNIQDTYQRVVQTDGTNLADGTGSLLPISFEGNDVIVPGALKAQSYIVSESIINVSSGSTVFGDSADDSHNFNGAITASGNISASGQIDADKIRTGGRIASSVFDIACVGSIDTDGTINSSGISNSSTYTGGGRLTLTGGESYIQTPSYISASQLISNGHITASGNISASSGDIIGSRALIDTRVVTPEINTDTTLTIVPNITASGNISASGIITAEGLVISDDATITDDLTVNGNILLSNGSSKIKVGDDDHPSITFGDDQLTLSSVQGDPVVITNPITVDGNITSTGNSTLGNTSTDTHTFNGHITASGNISASGELSVTDNAFIGGKLSVNTTSTAARVNVVGSEVHQLNGNANTFKITGVSSANALFVSSSTKVGIGTQTPGEQLEVVGNISASGDLTVNNINGTIDGGTF
tara:strand:- start:3326 stop:4597 length:1272 start_codon:yes stop_codon:yes gene_type:complete